MAELLQEGLAILISLALGASLLALLQPGVASLENTLIDRGGAVVLDDLKSLLELHEGYSVQLFIDRGVSGSYGDGVLTINLFGRDLSVRIDLGPYRFRIHDGCILESDGRGWMNVG